MKESFRLVCAAIVGVALFLAAGAASAQTEQRVALVIGNSAYKESPLPNPGNDAADMAKALSEMGFKVILRRNANTRAMREAIREFGTELRRAQVGLFYYAGHGVQIRGNNYLIPVGGDIRGEADVEDQAIDANYVLRSMEEAQTKVSIVILDACRNNPYASGFRSASRGLAQMTAATGTLIAFSTAPGSIAADGSGRNGLYTQHLLASLRQPDTDILKVFQRTRAGVVKETGGKQTPWESTSLTGDFYFRQGMQVASAPVSAADIAPPTIDPSASDRTFWESVKDSRNPDEVRLYLEQFPNGLYTALARTRLKSLESPTSTQVATAAPSIQVLAATPAQQDLQGLAAGSVFKDCDICPEMVMIPAGSYALGGTRQVTLARPFAVSKTEITFAQWDRCTAEGSCGQRPNDLNWGRGSNPVMRVSWHDAKEYTAWLSRKTGKTYRLLTEAEWEYAARAGTTTTYYWGDSDADVCRYANTGLGIFSTGCGTDRPAIVASRQPNGFGLYDMLGNVWEWVEDCWNRNVDGVSNDGSAQIGGDCSRRVVRGGAWNQLVSPRSAFRMDQSSTYRQSDTGFRITRPN